MLLQNNNVHIIRLFKKDINDYIIQSFIIQNVRTERCSSRRSNIKKRQLALGTRLHNFTTQSYFVLIYRMRL